MTYRHLAAFPARHGLHWHVQDARQLRLIQSDQLPAAPQFIAIHIASICDETGSTSGSALVPCSDFRIPPQQMAGCSTSCHDAGGT